MQNYTGYLAKLDRIFFITIQDSLWTAEERGRAFAHHLDRCVDVKAKVEVGDGGMGVSRQIPDHRDLHEGSEVPLARRRGNLSSFIYLKLLEIKAYWTLDSFKKFC